MGRKSNKHTFQLKKKYNINRMLSERWLITKWIKHVAAHVDFAHASGWNVKINSLIKKKFFQPITNLTPKTFWSRFSLQQSYKSDTQRFTRTHGRHLPSSQAHSRWVVYTVSSHLVDLIWPFSQAISAMQG